MVLVKEETTGLVASSWRQHPLPRRHDDSESKGARTCCGIIMVDEVAR